MSFLDGKPSLQQQAEKRKREQEEHKRRQEAERLDAWRTSIESKLDGLTLAVKDQVRRTWVETTLVINNNPQEFGKRRLPFNGLYVADGDAAKKLSVQVPGLGGEVYTVTLSAGFNQVNFPDDSVIFTQAQGDSVTVLCVWSDFPLKTS